MFSPQIVKLCCSKLKIIVICIRSYPVSRKQEVLKVR